MKSSIKIGYTGSQNQPCIKIVSINDDETLDDDVRDALIAHFLQTPLNTNPNDIFILDWYNQLSNGWVKAIVPLKNKDRLNFLNHTLIQTLRDWSVPFNEQKINALFEEIINAVENTKKD